MVLASIVSVDAAGIDVTPLNSVAVLEGGRVKPFQTFARESLRKVTGRASWEKSEEEKVPAVRVLAEMMFGDTQWSSAQIILCNYRPLKARMGLPVEQKFFAYSELSGNAELRRIISRVAARSDSDNMELDEMESEAVKLYERLNFFSALAGGEKIKLIPPPENGGKPWLRPSEAEAYYPERADAIAAAYAAIDSAYDAGDSARFAGAVEEFKTLMRELSPRIYPDASIIWLELTYNTMHPFRWAWILLLLSFLMILMYAKEGGLRRKLYVPAIILFLLSLVLQIVGFILRSMISGRAPVTNMYEVVVCMAFGAVLFGLIFELKYRNRYFALAASAVGVLALVLADNLPAVLDPGIKPLVPVLRSNFWLTLHVVTITLGYAAFMLALSIGHIVLGWCMFKPDDGKMIDRLTLFNYQSMQVGLLFLTAGTILGGVWANYAWGRFWGWDPKETWSLIAILCYLVVMHGRHTGWMRDFSLNVASILCFQAIIMAAYGVNYVLGKGLHSYGFGTGGQGAVAGYVVFEFLFVVAAVWRYKRVNAKVAA